MSKQILVLTALVVAALFGAMLYQNDVTNSKFLTTQWEPSDSALYDSWNDWKEKNGKQYGHDEETQRLSIYKKNVIFIHDHNKLFSAGQETFSVGMNEVMDLENDEFKKLYLGLAKPKSARNPQPILGHESQADSLDWRDKGAVTPVKNQGQCGSCWAFSTTGSLETAIFQKTNTLVSLSEQQLVDCSSSYGNQGCNGGLMDQAFQYVEKEGITSEDKYPYKGVTSKCSSAATADYKITAHIDVPQNSTSQLIAALQLNTVSIAIDAGGLWFQFYRSGVFHRCGTSLDHGVLAVGYGNENGQDYYLVKNSWGNSWGEKGYIKLLRNGDGPGTCGIHLSASYPRA